MKKYFIFLLIFSITLIGCGTTNTEKLNYFEQAEVFFKYDEDIGICEVINHSEKILIINIFLDEEKLNDGNWENYFGKMLSKASKQDWFDWDYISIEMWNCDKNKTYSSFLTISEGKLNILQETNWEHSLNELTQYKGLLKELIITCEVQLKTDYEYLKKLKDMYEKKGADTNVYFSEMEQSYTNGFGIIDNMKAVLEVDNVTIEEVQEGIGHMENLIELYVPIRESIFDLIK